MAREIAEQPEAARRLLAHLDTTLLGPLSAAPTSGLDLALKQASRLLFAACGSSRHAAALGRHAAITLAELPSEVDEAHELLPLGPNRWRDVGLCVVISQSGETQDTLEAAALAERYGVPLLALTNVAESALAERARWAVQVHAGEERAVPATKSFVGQAICCLALALRAGSLRAGPLGTAAVAAKQARAALADALRALPKRLEQLLAELEGPQRAALDGAAALLDDARSTVVLGRGAASAVAHEGALKLREGAYLPAQSFTVGEFKHGPMAMLEPARDVVVGLLEPQGATVGAEGADGRTQDNLGRLAALGLPMVLVAPVGHPAEAELRRAAPQALWLHTPAAPQLSWPILAAVVLQRLTLCVALRRGIDPDRPRYLVKSIDVH